MSHSLLIALRRPFCQHERVSMTMTTTTLTATRDFARGQYLLRDDHGRSRGSLQVGWGMRKAAIHTPEGTWAIRRHGWRQVTVGDPASPLVRLSPGSAMVPGPGPQPNWNVRRRRRGWQARLQRSDAAIDLRLAAPGARHCDVQITGDWPQVDLLTLTCCFAMLLRRRRLAIIAGGT